MSTFFKLDCGGETVTIEKTDDGDFIFHGWDEETELAAIELGFEPSACWIVWNAINNDTLDEELFEQSYRGNVLCVEALIWAGSSVEAERYDEWTPLHVVAANGNADVAEILLEAGASVDAKTYTGWTPLHVAAQDGHANVAKTLLKAGANVDAKDTAWVTPLKLALYYKKHDVVAVLESWIAEHGE